MITCPKCDRSLTEDDFGFQNKAKTIRNTHCRYCKSKRSQQWAKENPMNHRAHKNTVRYKKIEYLRALKSEPCMDCHTRFHFSAMDFDHRPGTIKLFGPSKGKDRGWKVLLAEVAKCDLVCANCHRVRTFKRTGGYEGLEE